MTIGCFVRGGNLFNEILKILKRYGKLVKGKKIENVQRNVIQDISLEFLRSGKKM